MHRWFAGSVVLAGSLLGMQLRGQAPVPTESYSDPVGGVSFRYPRVWTRSTLGSSPFGAVIAPDAEHLTGALSFSPVGNYYAATTLTGLDFLYRRVAEPNHEACVNILTRNPSQSGDRPEQVTINGVRFVHVATGDAGMSKSVSQNAYVTYRSGTCYLFEEDIDEVGRGVVPGKNRSLTVQERKALRRHLAEVMSTVHLAGPARDH